MPERQGSREGLCSQDRGVRGGGGLGAAEAPRVRVLGRGRSAEKSLACFQEERREGRSERTEVSSLRPPFPPWQTQRQQAASSVLSLSPGRHF